MSDSISYRVGRRVLTAVSFAILPGSLLAIGSQSGLAQGCPQIVLNGAARGKSVGGVVGRASTGGTGAPTGAGVPLGTVQPNTVPCTTPPSIMITAVGWTPTIPVPYLIIEYCSPNYGIDMSTNRVTLNGVRVDANDGRTMPLMSMTPDTMPNSGFCGVPARSGMTGQEIGRVTLRPGPDTLVAVVCDDLAHCSTRTNIYTYTPNWPVVVTPDDSLTRVFSAQPDSATFTLHRLDAGTDPGTYTIGRTCSAAETPCASVSAITLTGGQTKTVAVTFTGGASPSFGRIKLVATLSANAAMTDSGSDSVIASIPGIVINPKNVALNAAATGHNTAFFTATNTGPIAATYTMTGACAGSDTACAVSPASALIAAGAIIPVTIGYKAEALATTGTVTLRGVHVTIPTAKDTGFVHTTAITPSVMIATDASAGSTSERGLCLTVAAGHGAASECGDLRLAHAFPSIRTKNKSRTPTLIYNSAFAHPEPLVPLTITLPSGMPVPDSVTATLTINATVRASGKWTGIDWGYASARRIVLGFDALTDSTGLYPWTAQASSWYGATRYTTAILSGELAIVNRSRSNFGAGWWLAGLEKLYNLSDGSKLWIGGDGSTRHFKLLSGFSTIWLPPFLTETDGLSFDGTYYHHVMPHGLTVVFDATGRHVKTINRLMDTTSFFYTSQRLDSLQVPPTALLKRYLFTYDAATPNRMLSVVAPPLPTRSRITTITTSGGRITAIREPDSTVVGFGYAVGDTNRILSRTDRRGTVGTFGYNAAKKMVVDSVAGTATHFRPGQSVGWLPTSVDTALAYGLIDGPRTDVGDTTLVWLDKYGEPRHLRDALGHDTKLSRTNSEFPALVTRMQAPNGRVVVATYDNHGNIASSIDSGSCVSGVCATTTYVWDPAWDFLAKVTAPLGEVSLSSYDPVFGNKRWQQPDADSTNTARRVTFGYDGTWHLVDSVKQPVVTQPERVFYDAMGNVDSVKTPTGIPTRYSLDAIGRDTLVRSTIMSSDSVGVFTKTWYDVADEDTLSRTYSAPGTSDTITVRQSYDPEGNLLSHASRAAPDTNHLGWLTHSYTYDALNRKITEAPQGPSFGQNTYEYDAAGNDTSTNLRNSAFTMQYDVLNRLVKRMIPSVGTVGIASYTFGSTMPADTLTFAYDVAGNMVTANNYFARISRTYNLNGTLATDTSRIRAADSAATTFPDIYGIRYGYDREGRRIWMKHPANLANAGSDSVAYTYDATTGLLASVRDLFGNRFGFGYDAALRLKTDTALAGTAAALTQTRTYDDDSRQVARTQTQVVGGVVTTRYSDALTYDARNKMTFASFVIPELAASHATMSFARLGPMLTDQMAGVMNEAMTSDALGNQRTDANSISGTTATTNYYDRSGSAELDTAVTIPSINQTQPDTTFSGYNLAGSLFSTRTLTSAHGGGAIPQVVGRAGELQQAHPLASCPTCDVWVYARRQVSNRYTADNHLIASQTQLDSVNLEINPVYTEHEEYRYDALGRRVWRWLDRGTLLCTKMNHATGCRAIVQETVWDGEQVLWDVRQVTPPPGQSLSFEFTGNAVYTHGAGIDHPLSIGRTGTLSEVIIPRYDWRGKAVAGYCVDGTSMCTDLAWPGQTQSAWAAVPPPTDINGLPKAWGGDVIDAGTDGSGYVYMRNRYYDPSTGRFTQTDPIGLAGGLNAYGFAGGDPVNFSDPFGLWPCPELCAAGAAGGTIGLGEAFSAAAIEGAASAGGALAAAGGIAYVLIRPAFPGDHQLMTRTSAGAFPADATSVSSKKNYRSNDLPAKGTPGTSGVKDDGKGKGQIRDYGEDGRAETDYDFGHDHTGAGDPHGHDWDWSNPSDPRGPARPIGPNETPPSTQQ